MAETERIRAGQVLIGSIFDEPMRVETVTPNGRDSWVVGLVGLRTERFRRVTLGAAELSALQIEETNFTFSGDGSVLRLGLQAYSLGIAYEFDPYFGLSISRVDPLPHQLEAVYDYLLKLPRVRFLLADDAGAGKTIMAGLLMRELKLRGLAERILVVCPANLSFQWQRELADKFDETFHRIKSGRDIDGDYGVNPWLEKDRFIVSMDLVRYEHFRPALTQCDWDLVIIDEAHRMSASAADRKTLRYRLGELLRDHSAHILLLTATPHKGDPANFTLFLQLLDQDVYADVKSIRQAMEQRRAPFYLRRTKEAMVYFPEQQEDGSWIARKIFTKRIPRTVDFSIDGAEFELYREVTRFVKRQSVKAALQGEDPRARAIGFLMSLYQRRLASSTHSLRCSLENRVKRLETNLRNARELAKSAPPELPGAEELEEMEDEERERFEKLFEAVTLSQNPKDIQDEIAELKPVAARAAEVEQAGTEAKLSRLRNLMQDEGFFDDPDQRLLLFTEFKDTLDYLMKCMEEWGFRVGCIHGGMKSGSRDQPGTRLYVEQQFREGAIQVLVATEAAGEGINLQCCHIMFNYDIPWNPNRLEQRMGRIHRYGQTKDCLIFNFVATNTIEGRVLTKLLDRLQEIRDALDDDAVFNVVGEILPAAHVDRVLRDYYGGKLGDEDLEERLLKNVNEERFRGICQNALEGLASKKLNLNMLVERRARAKERRLVPEAVARFMQDVAPHVPLALRTARALPHTFDPGRTPTVLRRCEREPGWRFGTIANRYSRLSTDRNTAEENNLEWVTPGHPLFESMRIHMLTTAEGSFRQGACFYSLSHQESARVDLWRARVVDGLGQVVHERLFAVEIPSDGEPRLVEPGALGNLQPVSRESGSRLELPEVAHAAEPRAWLHECALVPFLNEVRDERVAEVERVAAHVELSLTELIEREDMQIGRFSEEAEKGLEGAAGNLKKAEDRHAELLSRRQKRRDELNRQKALTLQAVERLTSILVLPHPEREKVEVRNLQPDPEVEKTAMRVAMEYERAQGRVVLDVHEKNLGYDITGLDTKSGELRLIEVKGIGEAKGTVLLTPNERRVAEDRRDCYWLYVVTSCKTGPKIQEPIDDPARFPWHEVKKIDHYWLEVNAITKPMQVREDSSQYGNTGPREDDK